jgi:hypothetical protein
MNSIQRSPRLLGFAMVAFAIFIWLNWFPPGGIDEQMSVEIESPLSKSEVTVIAEHFIADHYEVGQLDSLVSFNSYQDANGYFLREQILDLYKSSWKSAIPIDYYEVTTQDKEKKLKFKVYIRMKDGSIFGWKLQNPEEYTGSPQPEPFKLNVLADMGFDLKDFERSEGLNELIYKHRQSVGEASLQLHQLQLGQLITGFTPVFELPDTYVTWKKQQDSLGQTWSLISLLLWFGLAVAATVYMVKYRKTMSFGRGVILSLIFLIPYLIHNVNMYPSYMLGNTDSTEALVLVILSQLITMVMAVTVYVCLVAGDGMWRKMDYQLWPTNKDPNYGTILVRSMGNGYLICIITLGFQSLLFFVAGKLFDVWSTSDPQMSTHNLLEPSLFPLLAWSAAISEEAVFRMFGIIFFIYVFRSMFNGIYRVTGFMFLQNKIVHLIPAIVLSNMIWALGHTGYSIYPVYTRFIEVTLLGFIFAYAFLRFGLITAIFAHASMDIIIMGLQIMSVDAGHALLGLLYMLMPAIVAWVLNFLWLLRRTSSSYSGN